MIKKNNLRNCKKAFAFTFLAFFISIVIFAFVAMNMNKSNYTKDNDFKDARISYINDEIKYFRNSYVNSILSYSLYSTLDIFTNYSRVDSNYQKYYNNYSKFQDFLVEGMINGSFDSEAQGSLENKTITYFINKFSENFNDAYKGNFSFKILNLYLFEDRPYYVSAQMDVLYNITTSDNISSWNFEDEFVVSIPIDSLYDPEFRILADLNVTVRPSERYLSEKNWTLLMFKEALNKNYSLVFYEPKYKYTIGGSYLSRFMNVSVNSYKDVLGFWNFDYDEKNQGVLDSSIYSPLGMYYGNSRLLMNFDSSNILGNEVLDLSAYNNNGTINNGVNCGVVGISEEGCLFDGIDDYIIVKNNDSLNFTNTSFSISVWVNFNESFSTGGDENIISKSKAFILRRSNVSESNKTDFFIWDGVDYEPRISINNPKSGFNNIIAVYDLENLTLYLNGIKNATLVRGYYNISSIFPLYIGSLNNSDNFLNGTLDEVSLYSKALSDKEIANLYFKKKALYIDYIDSLHGKGIKFDGSDDYVKINTSTLKNIQDYSIGLWIKPLLNSSTLDLRQGIFKLTNKSGKMFRFFLNGTNYIEYDIYPGEIGNLQTKLILNQWQYLVITYDGSDLKFYKDGKVVDSAIIGNNPIGNATELELGWKAVARRFKGIIDEVKIYNRTLTREEIQRNYYNFNEFGKGCCNYITLINPNTMGYNNLGYDGNSSYSSKLFFDKYLRSNSLPEVTLYNITNITSKVFSENYYNFHLDKCIADAFSIFGFQEDDGNITTDIININTFEDGTNDCSNLIKRGYY